MKTNDKVSLIVKAAEDKNASNINVMDIKNISSLGDYFIIISGASSAQVSAIAEEIEEKMEEAGYHIFNQEGKNSMRWIILDYGDIIVHIFHKDEREYYKLERLWEENPDEF